MKTAIIMKSELLRHGRWDASFHLLNREYAGRANALSATMSKEEVIELLSDEEGVPTSVLSCLAPLTRGNSEKPTREKLLKAVGEYPFLAMAVVRDAGAKVLEAAKNELAEKVKKMESVQANLSAASPDIPHLLPIPYGEQGQLNKSRFVAGVVYFDGDTLAIPVETSHTAYVADCWVIELTEWTGPAMIDDLVAEGNVPVPRRHEDLGSAVGFVKELADHTVNYGRGWRETN